MDKSLHTQLLDFVADKGREIKYKKGESIFKQGTDVTHIVFVKKGFGKLYIEGENGKNIILDFTKPNTWVGFSTLNNDEGYPYTLTALTDLTLVYFSKKDIISADNMKTANILLSIQNNFCHHLFYKMNDLGTKNMFGRLASTILYLSDQEYLEGQIFEYLSRKDISEFSGMSIESMVRIMNELKNDKIIEQKGKLYLINDPELLYRLAKLG